MALRVAPPLLRPCIAFQTFGERMYSILGLAALLARFRASWRAIAVG